MEARAREVHNPNRHTPSCPQADLLKEVAQDNPFQTSHFVWVDFGAHARFFGQVGVAVLAARCQGSRGGGGC